MRKDQFSQVDHAAKLATGELQFHKKLRSIPQDYKVAFFGDKGTGKTNLAAIWLFDILKAAEAYGERIAIYHSGSLNPHLFPEVYPSNVLPYILNDKWRDEENKARIKAGKGPLLPGIVFMDEVVSILNSTRSNSHGNVSFSMDDRQSRKLQTSVWYTTISEDYVGKALLGDLKVKVNTQSPWITDWGPHSKCWANAYDDRPEWKYHAPEGWSDEAIRLMVDDHDDPEGRIVSCWDSQFADPPRERFDIQYKVTVYSPGRKPKTYKNQKVYCAHRFWGFSNTLNRVETTLDDTAANRQRDTQKQRDKAIRELIKRGYVYESDIVEMALKEYNVEILEKEVTSAFNRIKAAKKRLEDGEKEYA